MKLTTQVIVGFRNVGSPGEQESSELMQVGEALKWLTQRLAKCTMAKRVEIVIGRTQDDIRKSWEPYKTSGQQTAESLDDELARIMAEHGIEGEL